MLKYSTVKENGLEISYFIKSTPEEVYSAWTDAKKVVKWMGLGSVFCEEVEIDLKVGGHYRINMNTNEGVRIAKGEYKEIVLNEKLVFTWEWEGGTFKNSLVSIVFTHQDGGTLITLQHTLLPNKENTEHHTQGWEACMIKLESYLTTTS
ncbi:MAG: SRPBCC domain-containing protein [Proteobacteria bacterium]|nr:SRPBCC domain-containing protein [Pseudomonadota bacterium]